ncbi:MAG TPA: NYN domain-containing protein [Acidimicrobiales bacterium]|nr:NYN domain-containing protein [Acidimicrobiales bacterium]
MARLGLSERTPVEPPRALRPLLRFTRLPARGVAVIRRVLDEDEPFRARVAAAAQGAEDELGRPSWLFLVRPPGWDDELARLTAEREQATEAAEDVATEQRAERRLRAAQEHIARLEAVAAAAQGREAEAAGELAALRRARQAEVEQVQELEGQLAAERQEADRLRAALEASKAAAESKAKAAVTQPPAAPPAAPAPSGPPVEAAALRAALAEAADAARTAARSLDDAMGLLPGPGSADETTPARPGPPLAASPPAQPTAKSSPAPPKPSAPRRRPVPLPPGILDDTHEAAEHLVRTNGVVVLVDGYNATISAWPNLPLAEQRHRLVDALAELVARTGADAQVVFDGDQDTAAPSVVRRPPGAARPPVRVVFSPADQPADDVILDLVGRVPLHRPVVVASDDRRVQEGAVARGANVLTRSQLLALLRRGPSSALG